MLLVENLFYNTKSLARFATFQLKNTSFCSSTPNSNAKLQDINMLNNQSYISAVLAP